jgi:hypothetical protein
MNDGAVLQTVKYTRFKKFGSCFTFPGILTFERRSSHDRSDIRSDKKTGQYKGQATIARIQCCHSPSSLFVSHIQAKLVQWPS